MIAVLGMHRSGTSVVTGMLADQGVFLGEASSDGLMNPRGTMELRSLNRLHERILRRAGARWWRPPVESIAVGEADRAELDEILDPLRAREPAAIKDPRMLLLPELWRGVRVERIGVIRNPIDVADSLDERRRARGGEFPRRRGVKLWCEYNRRLLTLLELESFPVVDFDRRHDLAEQVTAALAGHGVGGDGRYEFFEDRLVRGGSPDEWRQLVGPDAIELWTRLQGFVGVPG